MSLTIFQKAEVHEIERAFSEAADRYDRAAHDAAKKRLEALSKEQREYYRERLIRSFRRIDDELREACNAFAERYAAEHGEASLDELIAEMEAEANPH